MKKDFSEHFLELINEPGFKRLKRSYTNYSIFSFTDLREDHTTNLISWLLNTREAHKSHIFFDFFLGEVERALQVSEILYKSELLESVSKLQGSKKARKSYIFETEKNMNDNGRCDVVGISLNQHVPIYIENKINSGLTGDQLHRYMECADENAVTTKPLLIFMDANSERNLLEKPSLEAVSARWLPISYDWIGGAIEEYLSAPAPGEVGFILRSFQTELEEYISIDIDKKNIFWSDAQQDLARLSKKYQSLFQDKDYHKLSNQTPLSFPGSKFKKQPHLSARLKYSEIFEDIGQYNVFNALEYSEAFNPGFEYETDIARKYAYFYPGGLDEVDDFWPVDIKLHQRNITSGVENTDDGKTVYDLSLSVIDQKYIGDYAQKIREHFNKKKAGEYKISNLELPEVRGHLFKNLKALKAEIDVFNSKYN